MRPYAFLKLTTQLRASRIRDSRQEILEHVEIIHYGWSCYAAFSAYYSLARIKRNPFLSYC